jgi:restriction system protein
LGLFFFMARMRTTVPDIKIPSHLDLLNPLLDALRELGGSASVEEIELRVIDRMGLSDEVLAEMHTQNQTEVGYRLAWARTYLKKFGLLENSVRGVWAVTDAARNYPSVSPSEVAKKVREMSRLKAAPDKRSSSSLRGEEPDELREESDWKSKLSMVLTENLSPQAFERLIQRLLRESGFIQVEVLGKTGDGGIDGKGIARIHGLMSFHVYFQCKRYKGSVSAGDIRDFRGAMQGRADKGLFVTTGTFTSSAVKEASRDGAPPIDLLDGSELAEKLKEFGLGISTQMVEHVSVKEEWFANLG